MYVLLLLNKTSIQEHVHATNMCMPLTVQSIYIYIAYLEANLIRNHLSLTRVW